SITPRAKKLSPQLGANLIFLLPVAKTVECESKMAQKRAFQSNKANGHARARYCYAVLGGKEG
ncbi:unnamed protein product, partial [marine sediment metagenome]